MPIKYFSDQKLFKLDTAASSYIFEVYEENYLIHLYYGAKIPDANVGSLRYRSMFASFSPSNPHVCDPGFSADVYPMEYSCNGAGDFRISALQIKAANGCATTDIRYVSHKIYPGKHLIPGLPCLYANNDDEAQTLEIYAEDKVTGALVTLYYTVFENKSAMTRSATITNTSDKDMSIERAYSFCLDMPEYGYDMLTLYGRHNKERSVEKRRLAHGIQSIASKRGSSSHQQNPFVALLSENGSEDFGDAYGFNLVYSCNFSADIEVDTNGSSRVIMGINPSDFAWKLVPGDSFNTPEAVMVYSNEGLGGMSRTFHRLYSDNLVRGEWKYKKRPLLINSWEAAYFDFDDDKLVSFAEKAKELGIEMLVMDDGWFGVRNDDRRSLGDWYVNEKKLKGGLSPMIDRINALGLKFGIWYEPEMISPDSDLFRAHPDWYVHVCGRESSIGRQQYVLDMSRQDVRDNIFAQMCSVLENNKIDYVKWDFNRNISEAGSAVLPADRQKEFFHRFILGTYELMFRLREKFPHILLENCSGGGGRFDPGMFCFSPQIWCSDNTDPIERIDIQFGSSLCYPASVMGAHVSACSRTGLETRANVASWGTFGYELDPNKLSDTEKREVRREISEYHKYYELINRGDLYRIISPFDNPFRAAWEFVSQDKNEALATIVQMRKHEAETFIFKFKGLAADKYYKCDFDDEIYSGALLMNAGINLNCFRGAGDGESMRIYLCATQI